MTTSAEKTKLVVPLQNRVEVRYNQLLLPARYGPKLELAMLLFGSIIGAITVASLRVTRSCNREELQIFCIYVLPFVGDVLSRPLLH